MHLRRLWLHAFRSYTEADVALAPGLTVVRGANGTGKTNLLEAAGYLATLGSFRGAPSEAMVQLVPGFEAVNDEGFVAGVGGRSQGRIDAARDRAVIRGEVRRGARELLIEKETSPVDESPRLPPHRRRPR